MCSRGAGPSRGLRPKTHFLSRVGVLTANPLLPWKREDCDTSGLGGSVGGGSRQLFLWSRPGSLSRAAERGWLFGSHDVCKKVRVIAKRVELICDKHGVQASGGPAAAGPGFGDRGLRPTPDLLPPFHSLPAPITASSPYGLRAQSGRALRSQNIPGLLGTRTAACLHLQGADTSGGSLPAESEAEGRLRGPDGPSGPQPGHAEDISGERLPGRVWVGGGRRIGLIFSFPS